MKPYGIHETDAAHIPLNALCVVPDAVAVNDSLSAAAVRLYALIDGRLQGRSGPIPQTLLADDIAKGRSPAAARRAVQRAQRELIAAGLLDVRRTGRASIYTLRNIIRD